MPVIYEDFTVGLLSTDWRMLRTDAERNNMSFEAYIREVLEQQALRLMLNEEN